MIEEYKRYLRQNTNDIFTAFTIGVGILTFFFLMLGGVVTAKMVTTHINNNKQLSVYRENLATFQKCAEKIEDTSLIRSYCGDAPSEPILIW